MNQSVNEPRHGEDTTNYRTNLNEKLREGLGFELEFDRHRRQVISNYRLFKPKAATTLPEKECWKVVSFILVAQGCELMYFIAVSL